MIEPLRTEGREFRLKVALRRSDVPRLRALVDFHGSRWGPDSVLDTLREIGSPTDLRLVTAEEELRAEQVEQELRSAELAVRNCEVNT